MTQQSQKEYIITEQQIQDIIEMEQYPGFAADIFRNIRSRPLATHTSSTEAQAVRIHKILLENRDDIISRLSESFSPETIEEMWDISSKHDAAIRNRVIHELRCVVASLYDSGFKNPIVIFDCAVDYIKNPTVSGHPEKQSLRTAQHTGDDAECP